MSMFPVQGMGNTTNEALADARSEAAIWTAGDNRWIESDEDYHIWRTGDKKRQPVVVCTLWLELREPAL